MLEGKHIAILGAGRSGRAAAALAVKYGASVCVYDSRGIGCFGGMLEGVDMVADATVEMGFEVESDYLVISPGIDTYGEFVKAFSVKTGELIGETELAARFYKGKVIGITGTNGKTTTTELVTRIMRAGGVSCESCGNYGVPFSEILLMDKVPDSVALELSSFQLETVKEFRADVAIWLNFSPDHMDRYHSVSDYKRAKSRIFENQNSENFAVVRKGEDVTCGLSKVVTFSTEESGADYSLEDGWIVTDGEKVLDLSVTRLRGLHNAENAMAALAACRAVGVDVASANEALKEFAPPLHRCELIRILDDVEYLNDSKATNLHALESALRSQTRDVVLIAGGKEKGLNYEEVVLRLRKHARGAVVFGEIAEQLEEVFNRAVPTRRVSNLDEAVITAKQMSEAGDVILFSPGTSSFDQFSGYEDRGNQFRNLVLNLK